MPMNNNYLNAIRDHGQTLITHIGLVDSLGAELTSGSYARKPVAWVDSADGVSRPSADIPFDVEAGDEVAGWRGYSAAAAGVDYGGADFAAKNFANPGQFTLLAAQTSIPHTAA